MNPPESAEAAEFRKMAQAFRDRGVSMRQMQEIARDVHGEPDRAYAVATCYRDVRTAILDAQKKCEEQAKTLRTLRLRTDDVDAMWARLNASLVALADLARERGFIQGP